MLLTYAKPYAKRGITNAMDSETIAEAVIRPTKFVVVTTVKRPVALMSYGACDGGPVYWGEAKGEHLFLDPVMPFKELPIKIARNLSNERATLLTSGRLELTHFPGLGLSDRILDAGMIPQSPEPSGCDATGRRVGCCVRRNLRCKPDSAGQELQHAREELTDQGRLHSGGLGKNSRPDTVQKPISALDQLFLPRGERLRKRHHTISVYGRSRLRSRSHVLIDRGSSLICKWQPSMWRSAKRQNRAKIYLVRSCWRVISS